MTTELEEIRELLNFKLRIGKINHEEFKTLEEIITRYYEDCKNRIENINLFVGGLIDLITLGYNKEDISTILNEILNLGTNEIDKLLFDVYIHIYDKYDEEFKKYFEKKLEYIKKIVESSPNIDDILDKLDKIKVFSNNNDKEYTEIRNSIEDIKKYKPSLNYVYNIIQNWQDRNYIEKIKDAERQISCTVKNLEYIKNNLENIEKDPKYAKNLKDILNIKRELDNYYDGLLKISELLNTYEQSYIKFREEYLPKLLFEGLDYIKKYTNINSNREK
jgi:DNA-binding protein